MFVPIRYAVIIARSKAATIRQWAHRGKITTACDRHTKEVTYLIADLMALERATRQKSQRPAA